MIYKVPNSQKESECKERIRAQC